MQDAPMEASEFVRYRANVTSLAKGGFTIDATVEMQRGDLTGKPEAMEADILLCLRSFVAKLRGEYPPQENVKP